MTFLHSANITKKEFRKRFFGLDPDEVLAFLREIALEWEHAERERGELDRKIIELETQSKNFHSMEDALQRMLTQAQETSGKAVDSARKEAQLILQEAELKAAHILEKARNDLTAVKEQVVILKAKKESIVARLRMLLNSEIEIIKALEVDEDYQRKNPDTHQQFSKKQTEIDEIMRSLALEP